MHSMKSVHLHAHEQPHQGGGPVRGHQGRCGRSTQAVQAVAGCISAGDRCYGGNVVFVPRQQEISALKGQAPI